VHNFADRLPSPQTAVRLALAAFVLAWVFGPYALRSAVPIWIAFAIGAGLELHFLVRALGPSPARLPDRGPQTVDRERYGYEAAQDDLLLVRREGAELWIPYSGEEGKELEELVSRSHDQETEPLEPFLDPREARSTWRPVSRFLTGLGVIATLAAVVWLVETRTGWDALDEGARAEATALFSAEASRIAGKPVAIRCDESGEHVGVVQHADGAAGVGGSVAYLTLQRCLDLYRLAFEGEVTSSQTARALAVLAHEAWHLRGVADEATTECYALQSGVELGRRLGLLQDRAAQLMRQQLVLNQDAGNENLEYLVPAGCRDGGRFDLDSATTRFP
jgi:hypothetical protein